MRLCEKKKAEKNVTRDRQTGDTKGKKVKEY